MHHDIFWTPWEGPGVEHLRLSETAEGVVADGLIVGATTVSPFRVQYTIRCDARWQVRQLDMYSLTSDAHAIHLRTDGAGLWTTETGEPLPNLDGCLDLDISATPFTNTLPIRRLNLQSGDSLEVQMVYIAASDCKATSLKQRYTCLKRRAIGKDTLQPTVAPSQSDLTQLQVSGIYCVEGSYRSGSLLHQFRAELPVDVDGLVIEYPDLFRRVQP